VTQNWLLAWGLQHVLSVMYTILVCVCECLSVYLESKYCPLLESEGGLSLLEPLAETNNSRFHQIPKLAQQILRQCRKFRLSADSQSTDDLDDLSASVDVNDVDMTDDSDNDVMVDDSDDDIGLDY